MKKLIFPVLFIAIMVMTGCASPNDASEEANKKTTTDLPLLPQVTASAQDETYENPLPLVQETSPVQYELAELKHAYVTVEGMDCPSCAITIEYSLKDLGVTDSSINPVGTGEIIYNPAIITENDLKAAIDPYIMTIVKTEPATSYSLN